MAKEKGNAEKLIETGADIAGAAVGGAVGFLAVGPGGAAAAGVLGVAISRGLAKVVGDVANRQLSHKEEVRVGAAAAVAADRIRKQLESGGQPRQDGFFESINGEAPTGESLFEGVLLKSKNEHEEKKVTLLGNFFSNLAFSPGVGVAEANHLLRVAESLTYRQICALALFALKAKGSDVKLRESSYRAKLGGVSFETLSTLQEIQDLYSRGLVVCKDELGSGYEALFGWTDVCPERMEPTYLGERLIRLLGIADISLRDIDLVVFCIGPSSVKPAA
jgi:hypothetical protein